MRCRPAGDVLHADLRAPRWCCCSYTFHHTHTFHPFCFRFTLVTILPQKRPTAMFTELCYINTYIHKKKKSPQVHFPREIGAAYSGGPRFFWSVIIYLFLGGGGALHFFPKDNFPPKFLLNCPKIVFISFNVLSRQDKSCICVLWYSLLFCHN